MTSPADTDSNAAVATVLLIHARAVLNVAGDHPSPYKAIFACGCLTSLVGIAIAVLPEGHATIAALTRAKEVMQAHAEPLRAAMVAAEASGAVGGASKETN